MSLREAAERAAVGDDELARLEAEDAEREFPRIAPELWVRIHELRAEGEAVTHRALEQARWVTYRRNLPVWAARLQRSPKFGPSRVTIVVDGRTRVPRTPRASAPRRLRMVARRREHRARARAPRGSPRRDDDPEPEPDLVAVPLGAFLAAVDRWLEGET